MLLTGQQDGYHYLQTAAEGCDFIRFAEECAHLLTDRAVAVVSWDSDSMCLTEEERRRGWTFHQEVAYHPRLNAAELREDIFANSYDEWYLFPTITILHSRNDFVNYSGFRLHDLRESELYQNLARRFWEQVSVNQPESFVLYGDNFIYGSRDDQCFARAVTGLTVG